MLATVFHPNIGVVEFLWSFGAITGLAVNTLNFTDSVVKMNTLKKAGANSIRSYVAETSIIREGGNAVVMLLFLAFGIYSMTQPQPPTVWDIRQIFVITMFLGAEFSLTAISIWVKHRNNTLFKAMLRREAH